MSNRRLIESFRNAFAGWGHAIRHQRNARIHLIITVSMLGVAAWLGLERIEWSLLLLAAGLVWAAELTNTALEAAVDLVSPEHRQLARTAKDVSAGAVLAAAIAAAAVGVLILGPRILDRLG